MFHPSYVKKLIKENNISQKMVAAAIGCSSTLVCKALAGIHVEALQRISDVCTPEWINENRRPLVSNDGISEIDEEKVDRCKSTVYDIAAQINSLRPNSFQIYHDRIRGFSSYVIYHYFGLIKNCDLMIDEHPQRRLSFDHAMSIKDGYNNMVPFYMIGCPLNLEVIDTDLNLSKGSKSSKNGDDVISAFNEFINANERYWIVISQSILRLGIPKPFALSEKLVGQNYYKSKTSGKTFRETHAQYWGKSGAMIELSW